MSRENRESFFCGGSLSVTSDDKRRQKLYENPHGMKVLVKSFYFVAKGSFVKGN